jgi:hypothetical protein
MIEDQHGFYHAIPIQSGTIALRIKVEDFGQHSLLPFLNLFGKLYLGNINQAYFDQLFTPKRQRFLQDLNSVATNRDLEFQLSMARLALTTEWKWPAFVNMVHSDGELEWATGGSRILASGLSKPNPEQTISVLLFDQTKTVVDQWLVDPIEITTDEHLHQVLNLTYTQTQSPTIQLSSVLKQVGNHTRLFLHGIIDEELQGYQNSNESTDLKLLDNLKRWQTNNPRPQLEIYTNWPELISDSLGVWDCHIVGPIPQVSSPDFKPGHLERLAKMNAENNKAKHILYVRNPRPIDLSEFLVWIDTEHTAFIEMNWDFLLYQTTPGYQSKMISFSRI